VDLSRWNTMLELELLKRHTSLWCLYVFTPPGTAKRKNQQLVDAVEELFALGNELPIETTQRSLPLWVSTPAAP